MILRTISFQFDLITVISIKFNVELTRIAELAGVDFSQMVQMVLSQIFHFFQTTERTA